MSYSPINGRQKKKKKKKKRKENVPYFSYLDGKNAKIRFMKTTYNCWHEASSWNQFSLYWWQDFF